MSFQDYMVVRIKSVMHSLNDMKVLLQSSVTRAYVLEALRGENTKVTVKDEEEFELGLSTIKQFLKALIEVVLQCHGQSVLAELVPTSQKLCQTAFKVSKLILA
jgi:hypothetical protein